jgi:serine phosphatase RsbU (regulator of sigma subunit)
MALCTVDLKKHTVEYAGAKNPLVYVQDGELVRLKADRLPIGLSYAKDESFHNQQIDVKSSTCFYMFSDGYPDQFGGDKGGKFMLKRLQNLFLEIHQESMAKQKEILERTLDEWMENEVQIDDILVIGFKLK